MEVASGWKICCCVWCVCMCVKQSEQYRGDESESAVRWTQRSIIRAAPPHNMWIQYVITCTACCVPHHLSRCLLTSDELGIGCSLPLFFSFFFFLLLSHHPCWLHRHFSHTAHLNILPPSCIQGPFCIAILKSEIHRRRCCPAGWFLPTRNITTPLLSHFHDVLKVALQSAKYHLPSTNLLALTRGAHSKGYL